MPSPKRRFLLQHLQGGCHGAIWCKDLLNFPLDVGSGGQEVTGSLALVLLGWSHWGPCSHQGINSFTSFQMQSSGKAVARERGLCRAGANTL